MKYRIGFPIDHGKASHIVLVKPFVGSNHMVKNCASSEIRKDTGAYAAFNIFPNKSLKYEFEIIPTSKDQKLSPKNISETGNSDTAACYFALQSYPNVAPENAPIVLMSMFILGNDLANAKLENIETDKESLKNKLSAAKNHGAIALFLHDRDAQKLQENCKIETLLPHCLDNAKPGDPTVISCQSDDITLLGQIIGLPMPRKKLNKAWIYALILLGIAALVLLCYFFALPEKKQYPIQEEPRESLLGVRIVEDEDEEYEEKLYKIRIETLAKLYLFITQEDGNNVQKTIFPPVKVKNHNEVKLRNPLGIKRYDIPDGEDFWFTLDGTKGMEKLYCFYSASKIPTELKFYNKLINKLPKNINYNVSGKYFFNMGNGIYLMLRVFTVK